MNFEKNNQKNKKKEQVLFKIGNTKFDRDKVLAFGSFILVTFLILITNNEKKKLTLELINNKKFMFSFFLAICFSIYTLYFLPKNQDYQKITRATKQAIIGLVIGMFHYLDFKVGPFWFIWLVSYYLDLSE